MEFVPPSKHASSRLQNPISECCVRKQSLFVLRCVQKTYPQYGVWAERISFET